MKKPSISRLDGLTSGLGKVRGFFRNLLRKFLARYPVAVNYYVISIFFMLLFTFILILVIGSNVLRHEAYILKKEFTDRNKEYTREAAEKTGAYMENLDTLSVVDLVDRISKQDSVVYAYVLNSGGEVIAHSVRSELFKKYDDKFLDGRRLPLFARKAAEVWTREANYKGEPIVKFSKPVILQFTKKDVIKELELSTGKTADKSEQAAAASSSKIVMPGTAAAGEEISRKFYIAGVVHIAYSLKTLNRIADFSKRRVLIYYLISYLLAILAGYFFGKLIESSLDKSRAHLTAILKEEEVKPIGLETRADTFRKLYTLINRLIHKFSDYTSRTQQEASRADSVTDGLISHMGAYLAGGAVITDHLLRIEFANAQALRFLNRAEDRVLSENLSEVMTGDPGVIEEINRMISRGAVRDEVSYTGKKAVYRFYPFFSSGELIRLLLIIEPASRDAKGGKQEKKAEEARTVEIPQVQKEEARESEKTEETEKSKISSRLKKI